MYKILCLTTGTEICWPKNYAYPSAITVPLEVQGDILDFNSLRFKGGTIYFNSEEHAS